MIVQITILYNVRGMKGCGGGMASLWWKWLEGKGFGKGWWELEGEQETIRVVSEDVLYLIELM